MTHVMKCSQCGDTAVINMPQHRLKLCADHLVAWVAKTVQKAVERYGLFTPYERILVAVSGGKDSLALWDILQQLGYHTEGLHIHLGIDDEGYSDVSLAKAAGFARGRGLSLHVVDVRETYGQSIVDVARGRRGGRTCAVCGLVKRHIMNEVAHKGGYDAIATGHNLDDEAAVLLMNTLHWERHYLAKQGPLLPSIHPHLARKVKPLVLLYERETAAYAIVREIDYVTQECPYAVGASSIRAKQIMNQLERHSPGTKVQFYLGFLRAREDGWLPSDEGLDDSVTACPRCGQPTMADGLCAFCRLWGGVW
jgi:tRNA-5-methyluridine54 2-sulfurtransferase